MGREESGTGGAVNRIRACHHPASTMTCPVYMPKLYGVKCRSGWEEEQDTVLLSTGTRGRKCGHTNNPKNLNEDAMTAVRILRANISWHNSKSSRWIAHESLRGSYSINTIICKWMGKGWRAASHSDIFLLSRGQEMRQWRQTLRNA